MKPITVSLFNNDDQILELTLSDEKTQNFLDYAEIDVIAYHHFKLESSKFKQEFLFNPIVDVFHEADGFEYDILDENEIRFDIWHDDEDDIKNLISFIHQFFVR